MTTQKEVPNFAMVRGLGDIQKDIERITSVLSLTPNDDPNLPHLLADLGTSHKERYYRLGEINDIDKAIEYGSGALALTPEDDPDLPGLLETLGESHGIRFQRLGEIDDSEKELEYQSRALNLTTISHPNLPNRLTGLGLCHKARFERLGELNDIEKAIEYESRALSLTPDGHADLPGRLDNIGVSHKIRFKRLGELDDIEKALEYETRALTLTPDDHPNSASQFTNLGLSHKIRFERLGELNDIEKVIEYESRALALTPDGHPDKLGRLANLGASHNCRFQRLGEPDDLKKAFEYQTLELALTPDGHPVLPRQHHSLAVSLFHQSQLTGDSSQMQVSLEHFRKASQSLAGSSRERFMSSFEWAKLGSKHSSLNPIEAYQATIDVLPQFIWLGATTTQRYQDLLMIETMAVDAASAAIRSSDYPLALEWLELTRGVVWSQMLMLRSPLEKLQSAHPDLATRLHTVSDRLHRAGSELRKSEEVSSNPQTEKQVARQRRRLALEHHNLLSHARSLPGFEDLLGPMKANDLVRAARSGPIVVINCQADFCDALIIVPEQGNINHLPLPNFSREKVRQARSEMETAIKSEQFRERGVERQQEPGQVDIFGRVLASLWDGIVKPVLDYLGYKNDVPTDKLPHITWCPTGELSFLPLHAAGDYDRPRSRIFDYAISSFVPTLTALLATTPSSLSPDSRILAIGMESTPGHNSLPGITGELAFIKEHAQNIAEYSQLVNNEATTPAVLDAMERHDWVHLACHAHQNVQDPTRSGFFLYEGVLDLATINQRSFKKKGLAFLSACQTATGDEKLPDEAIHLASGMLMAGYSSVIATMWSVADEDGPFVADKVYGQLMKDRKVGNGEAGKALHHAVAELRDKVGEKEFARWVPYIHIGS
ncbi:unnamed protein product [Rhizoctonia solani]|uniref:CHAT domain-containing protein n=1 Tax=Rhizoctonia solani TaxID=456999 RepID=A0A8H3DJX7_9AGAM|nr:unnamed protein product [Rhizoctonia solani]